MRDEGVGAVVRGGGGAEVRGVRFLVLVEEVGACDWVGGVADFDGAGGGVVAAAGGGAGEGVPACGPEGRRSEDHGGDGVVVVGWLKERKR